MKRKKREWWTDCDPVKRWSAEELQVNEHFTQREDRTPYVAVIEQQGFLNKTMSYMRYAMGYDDVFPKVEHKFITK